MFKALRDLLPALVSASNQQTAITIASEIQANGFERYRPDQLSYMLHHGVDTIPTMSPSKSEGSPGDASTVAERSGESGLTSNTTPVSGIHAASSLPQNPSYYGSSVIPTESPQLKTRPPTESPYLSPTVSRPDSATARHGHNFIPSPLSIPATVSTIPSPVQGITEALHPVNMMNPGAFVTTGPVLDTKTELTTYPLEYQQVGVLDPQPVAETRQHVRPPRGATTPNPPATERKRYDPYARPNARTNPSRSSRLRGPTSVLPSSSANSAGPASATLVSELSRIVDRYQHAKQADIAAGHDPNIVLGPSGVDIGPIMQPTAIPTSNDDPIATFSAKLASMALPAHLHADRCGIAWIMSHVLRATIAPAYTSVYLPDWLQPTYSQATSFPDSLVNFIPWPSVREALCAGSAMPALTVLAASQVNWPFDGASTITYDYASGGWMLAPAFETHVQELGNWSLARSAATAVLGMGGGNVLQHEG
ncbi:hypothetical protein EJ05DRAFT_246725 [Pseudovirgaria hyperparasitica]|uniref:Uncharacterized protein n=1 Tax=Pseudovirgaria hyperparasitica TaxID=470096 RepID=A0A6A6WFU5_9PEZI|nr:uncharacterized protein EJ05DRAFT_246725 [Pseudovirgaria hyperparasitica]KAF2760934.1 hypothetical protein EJ05DRAFT_246725 [Pseudovirgaria hyperparasitica]